MKTDLTSHAPRDHQNTEIEAVLRDANGKIISIGRSFPPTHDGKTEYRPTDNASPDTILKRAKTLSLIDVAKNFPLQSINLCPTPGLVHYHCKISQ